MANLSAYIDFSISLNKGSGSSSMVLHDPDNYPPGVDVNLKGAFVITQPDGITITGNLLFPDISWDGSQLSDATKQLRLKSNGGFQQGEYSITYYVVAPGYDITELTKTFELNYTTPTLDVTDSFDVFTPSLSVTDETEYEQAGMTLDSVTWDWEATIISVEGTNEDISATTQSFDLSYLGSYYDSRYDVSLLATVTYTIDSPDDWVTIVDGISFEDTYYAFIPPTIAELLEMLTAYKATVDAANCICGTACVDNCTSLKATYTLAVSIYTHIVERGRAGETTGLSAYVIQLQKLLSNCVTPAYTNTNEAIPPYDWGGSTSGSFVFFKQMIVGSGVNDAPADGATTYTDALLVGKSVMVFLDSLLMGNNLSDRVSITYSTGTGTITWNTQLWSPQLISIYTF
jgi:hypothetical protein